MKKVIVSRKSPAAIQGRFDPEQLAKGLIFACEFESEKVAHVGYRPGKLTIHLGSKLKLD